MNVFLLDYHSPGEDMLEGIYSDIPSALDALAVLIEGLKEHVVMFYGIREWEVGSQEPVRQYKILMVDGKLVVKP